MVNAERSITGNISRNTHYTFFSETQTVTELFKQSYYYLDLLVGFAAPLFFYLLYRTGRINKRLWYFFWIGVFVGAIFEIPVFVLSAEGTSMPIILWHRPLITHYSVFVVAHSLWDGMIFIIGVWLIYAIRGKQALRKFSFPELLVMLVWGQVSALAVELSSTFNDGWSYYEYWWNPVIFRVHGYNITVLIQITWFIVSIVFYLLLVKLRPARWLNEKQQPALPCMEEVTGERTGL